MTRHPRRPSPGNRAARLARTPDPVALLSSRRSLFSDCVSSVCISLTRLKIDQERRVAKRRSIRSAEAIPTALRAKFSVSKRIAFSSVGTKYRSDRCPTRIVGSPLNTSELGGACLSATTKTPSSLSLSLPQSEIEARAFASSRRTHVDGRARRARSLALGSMADEDVRRAFCGPPDCGRRGFQISAPRLRLWR